MALWTQVFTERIGTPYYCSPQARGLTDCRWCWTWSAQNEIELDGWTCPHLGVSNGIPSRYTKAGIPSLATCGPRPSCCHQLPVGSKKLEKATKTSGLSIIFSSELAILGYLDPSRTHKNDEKRCFAEYIFAPLLEHLLEISGGSQPENASTWGHVAWWLTWCSWATLRQTRGAVGEIWVNLSLV